MRGNSTRHLSFLPAIALFTLAGPVEAHLKLLSANPTACAAVTEPASAELHFSEALMPQFSKENLTSTSLKDHSLVKLATTAAGATDGWTRTLTPQTALRPGQYSVGC